MRSRPGSQAEAPRETGVQPEPGLRAGVATCWGEVCVLCTWGHLCLLKLEYKQDPALSSMISGAEVRCIPQESGRVRGQH